MFSDIYKSKGGAKGMGNGAWSMWYIFLLLQIDNNYIGGKGVLDWESF